MNAILQVEPLSHLGGPLKACAAASFGGYITIYPLLSGSTASPKITWQAHAAHITKLHCSLHSIELFSAAADGTICRSALFQKISSQSTNCITVFALLLKPCSLLKKLTGGLSLLESKATQDRVYYLPASICEGPS